MSKKCIFSGKIAGRINEKGQFVVSSRCGMYLTEDGEYFSEDTMHLSESEKEQIEDIFKRIEPRAKKLESIKTIDE